MNAFIAAGASPNREDPLYPLTQGDSKAMLDVAGRPMIQWVLDALIESAEVEKVAIVGLDSERDLDSAAPLTYIPDQGNMLLNTLAGLAWVRQVNAEAEYALFCSADIPTISADMVDWRIQAALERAPFDLDYAVVTREQMEARFPSSNRTYVPLRDVSVCGSDLNLLRVDLMVRRQFWQRLFNARKSALRQAALLGFDMVLLLLLRRLSLSQAETRASAKLGLRGHVQLAPYPELAMDVDKPAQLKIVEQDLSQKPGKPA